MPFPDVSARPPKEIFAGVTLRAVWGRSLMMSFVDFAYDGAVVPVHCHPHEQMGMVLEGEIEFVIGGETRIVPAGDAYLIPSDVPHSARAVNGPARALDIFHPVREDYVDP